MCSEVPLTAFWSKNPLLFCCCSGYVFVVFVLLRFCSVLLVESVFTSCDLHPEIMKSFLQTEILFFPWIFFKDAELREVMGVYHPATFSPMLDSRVLPMQRPVSGPCVGWATLPRLSYLCQNFTPHPYILQPITCGVNPETPTCWAVLPHLSIFHLFYFPHCVWGEGP